MEELRIHVIRFLKVTNLSKIYLAQEIFADIFFRDIKRIFYIVFSLFEKIVFGKWKILISS